MRNILLFFLGLSLNCSPCLYGIWRSGSAYISFNPMHKFRAWSTDSTGNIEKSYISRTYNYKMKSYVDKCGPGKDTINYDQICFIYNKDTLPAFEYLLRPDTLLLGLYGESEGMIYIRK